jgi:hypothetical protein
MQAQCGRPWRHVSVPRRRRVADAGGAYTRNFMPPSHPSRVSRWAEDPERCTWGAAWFGWATSRWRRRCLGLRSPPRPKAWPQQLRHEYCYAIEFHRSTPMCGHAQVGATSTLDAVFRRKLPADCHDGARRAGVGSPTHRSTCTRPRRTHPRGSAGAAGPPLPLRACRPGPLKIIGSPAGAAESRSARRAGPRLGRPALPSMERDQG